MHFFMQRVGLRILWVPLGELTCSQKDYAKQVVYLASAAKRQKVEVKERDLKPEELKLFQGAKMKEVNSWLSTETVRRIARSQIPQDQILRSRWVLTWKPIEESPNGDKHKPKARLVILGYEDPHLESVARDSPTMGRDTRTLIATWHLEPPKKFKKSGRKEWASNVSSGTSGCVLLSLFPRAAPEPSSKNKTCRLHERSLMWPKAWWTRDRFWFHVQFFSTSLCRDGLKSDLLVIRIHNGSIERLQNHLLTVKRNMARSAEFRHCSSAWYSQLRISSSATASFTASPWDGFAGTLAGASWASFLMIPFLMAVILHHFRLGQRDLLQDQILHLHHSIKPLNWRRRPERLRQIKPLQLGSFVGMMGSFEKRKQSYSSLAKGSGYWILREKVSFVWP